MGQPRGELYRLRPKNGRGYIGCGEHCAGLRPVNELEVCRHSFAILDRGRSDMPRAGRTEAGKQANPPTEEKDCCAQRPPCSKSLTCNHSSPPGVCSTAPDTAPNILSNQGPVP